MASKPKLTPDVHGKNAATGKGVVPKPPNKLPNSNHVPKTGPYGK
jgi:hypothetical protein